MPERGKLLRETLCDCVALTYATKSLSLNMIFPQGGGGVLSRQGMRDRIDLVFREECHGRPGTSSILKNTICIGNAYSV